MGSPLKQFQGNALYTFSRKNPKDKDEVPADASLVVMAFQFITDNFDPYPKEALEAWNAIWPGGGKLLVLNPTPMLPNREIPDNGLPGFLKKYGVQVGKDYLLNFNENRKYRKTEFPPSGWWSPPRRRTLRTKSPGSSTNNSLTW